MPCIFDEEFNEIELEYIFFDYVYVEPFDDGLVDILEEHFFYLQQMENIYLYFGVMPSGGMDINIFSLTAEHRAELRSMYHSLNTHLSYILIDHHHFVYTGYYTGDAMFVDMPPTGMDLANRRITSMDGTEIYTTPLKGVQMGQMLINYFENYIATGRNFVESDFSVYAYDDIVNILMGFEYMAFYEIGDIITLSLYAHSKYFNFRVVGFYKEGTSFPSLIMPEENIYFDRAIIMPFFLLNYDPINETNERFHNIYHSMLLYGIIRIAEPIETVMKSVESFREIYIRYLSTVRGISYEYIMDLDIPLLPMPLRWPRH